MRTGTVGLRQTLLYIFSVIFKNTSVYDPYWSLVPWVLALIAMIETMNFTAPIIILFIAFSFWSWRLTFNWAVTFQNMTWEDWRYSQYRENFPRPVFELLNFVGLQMMPTVVVFGGLWPFLLLIQQGSNYIAILGAIVIMVGTTLEYFADHQMPMVSNHGFLVDAL